ncbi:MAG: hypothetical protein IKP67_00215, partial [Spirochaetales bacterium]|nr:hypothetical protein [Spirochaetales bacterium]
MNNFWNHIFAISGGEQSRTARYWKFILIFIFAFSLLTAVGCNNNQINMWSGAGVDPDLDAPVITITSPDNMATVGSVFMLTGTATDNVGVTSVEIQGLKTGLIKVSNIKNGKWKYTINNDLPSGAYTITVTAKDKAGNKSNTSTKTIAIIVDASSPIANINYPPLLTINELSALDYRDYGDIDFFQNKQFNIRGSVDDDY